MVKMIKEVTKGYIDSLLNDLGDNVEVVGKIETYKEIEISLRQQLEKNREEFTGYWIEAKMDNVEIDVSTLDEQNKQDEQSIYECIVDALKQELYKDYDKFLAGLDKDFDSLDLYADMLYKEGVATIFTLEEIDGIVSVIGQVVTQTADTLPDGLTEWIDWIVKLGKDSIDANTIKKIASRTMRSDISVKGCFYEYLGKLDTQMSSIEERMISVSGSFQD